MSNPIPTPPRRIARLPVDERDYPIPWFVQWIDGRPDFRVMDIDKLRRAIQYRKCWICGGTLGSHKTFVIGPMCAVNRVSAEPPSHRECAEYAARACPFLTQPKMRRREKDLPEHTKDAAGIMLKRNPGVTLLWTTKRYSLHKADGGVLFDIGQPEHVQWLARGQPATRKQVLESIESGLPILKEAAEKEGWRAVEAFNRQVKEAYRLLPGGVE